MTEHVVVIVVLARVAVVVQRSYANAEYLIYRGSLVTVGNDLNGVVIQLGNTGDVRHARRLAVAAFSVALSQELVDCLAEYVGAVSALIGTDVIRNAAGVLGISIIIGVFNGGIGFSTQIEGGAAVGSGQHFGIRIISTEAPHYHTESNFQAFVIVNVIGSYAQLRLSVIRRIVSRNVIHSVLYVGYPMLLHDGPVALLLFLGEGIALAPLMIGTGFLNSIGDGLILFKSVLSYLSAIGLQTLNGVRVQRGGTHIRRIQIYIVSKDNIIGGHMLAIGEVYVVANLYGIGGGVAGLVVLNGYIGRALIEVIGAVVINGFALYGVVDDTARAIGGQQAVQRKHVDYVNVVRAVSVELAELLAEFAVGDNQGSGTVFRGGCRSGIRHGHASGRSGQHRAERQSKELGNLAHWGVLLRIMYTGR